MNLRKWPLALKLVLHFISLVLTYLLYKIDFFSSNTTIYVFSQTLRILLILFFLAFLLNGYLKLQLYTKILLGLVLGIIAGLWIGNPIAELKPIGDAFIRLISLIVVPLVFASLLVGTASLNDVRKLGRIGGKTISYYLVTTSIAITIGLTLANIVKPGTGLNSQTRAELLQNYQKEAKTSLYKAGEKPKVIETLLEIIPKNPAESLAKGKMLQIIFFAMLMGISLTLISKEKAKLIIGFFEGINDAMVKIVHIVMVMAPYGVFALIANIIGQYGTGILQALVKYSLTVILGLLIHVTGVYPTALKILAKISIRKFFSGIRPAQIIAFSSSSSSATLPVTIECTEENPVSYTHLTLPTN